MAQVPHTEKEGLSPGRLRVPLLVDGSHSPTTDSRCDSQPGGGACGG